MNTKEFDFLYQIAQESKDPAMALKILQAVVSGIVVEAEQSRAHAVDMEVVANMAMNTRLFKGNESFIADKLDKWKHRSAVKWDDHIKKLRG